MESIGLRVQDQASWHPAGARDDFFTLHERQEEGMHMRAKLQPEGQATPVSFPVPSWSRREQKSATPRSQSTPPRQYTTVGSVYHPQQQPLQPPIRRGRVTKPLFAYGSEPTVTQSQLFYTPLQQNSQRAVSPCRSHLDPFSPVSFVPPGDKRSLQMSGMALAHEPLSPNFVEDFQFSRGGNRLVRYGSPDTPVYTSIIADGGFATDTSLDSNEESQDSEDANTKSIATMNINSLANLASYPNPMRRAAQQKLASHRPQLGPGSADSETKTRGFNAKAKPWVPSGEASMHSYLLSNGRGAPAPLTAGPPGVRQTRPMALYAGVMARTGEYDSMVMLNAKYDHHTIAQSHGGDVSEDEATTPNPDQVHHYRGIRTVDTLTAEEASVFYPNGLPQHFGLFPRPIASDWAAQRLAEVSNPVSYQSQPKYRQQRKMELDKLWYSGYNRYNTSFDTAVSQYHYRCMGYAFGNPNNELEKGQGRVSNRKMSSEEANAIPTSEHATRLLSMVFQALARNPAFSPNTNLPKYEHSLCPDYFKK
ncbi:hypothetical protein GGS20DRAFT_587685 [Poronia punctata]|nr:hypothetical protein GGS20DRAFT_587685 [Poronia punctata]